MQCLQFCFYNLVYNWRKIMMCLNQSHEILISTKCTKKRAKNQFLGVKIWKDIPLNIRTLPFKKFKLKYKLYVVQQSATTQKLLYHCSYKKNEYFSTFNILI